MTDRRHIDVVLDIEFEQRRAAQAAKIDGFCNYCKRRDNYVKAEWRLFIRNERQADLCTSCKTWSVNEFKHPYLERQYAGVDVCFEPLDSQLELGFGRLSVACSR